MFSIDMGYCEIVLGVEWLCTLGPILIHFKELTCNSNRRDIGMISKASTQAPLRSLVPIEWIISL